MLERRPLEIAGLGVVLLLALAFYLWTGTSSGNPVRFVDGDAGFFNQQTDGFLDGQLSLRARPPAELLRLPDPYDPAANDLFRQAGAHDLSLYRGRYYLTWGPTPVLTLFLPWRALPVGELPENLALVLYALAGLGFALALLRFLAARFAPRAPPWQVIAAGVALAAGNVAPFMLRRPAHYEVAIAAGYCFTFAGFYLLATGALVRPARIWRLAGGSLCLGLAVGARPDLVLTGAALVAVLAYLAHREGIGSWTGRAGLAVALLLPFVALVGLLLAYNQARFGSPLEFGQRYQLAGVEVAQRSTFDLAYLTPGLYYYLAAPVRWSLAFPFFHLPPPPPYPGGTPAGYDGVEATGGVLLTTPVLLALAAAPFTVRRRAAAELRWIVAGLAALGLALVALLAITFWGTTMRYEMDFASLLLLGALLAWLALAGGRGRRTIAVLGALAIAYGAVVGVAISFTGYYDGLRTGEPGAYRDLQDVTSPLPTLAAIVAGHPVLAEVTSPGGVLSHQDYATLDAGRPSFTLTPRPSEALIVSPDDEIATITGTVSAGGGARPGQPLRMLFRDSAVTQTLVLPPGPASFDVRLKQGLNRIQLSAPGAVAVTDLAIRRAR